MKNNYYLEFDFRFEEKTQEEIELFINEIKQLADKHGTKGIKAGLKINPTYDSFGNLWE